MTFREAWIEALRRNGASEKFLASEKLRQGIDFYSKDVDKPMKMKPGMTEEMLVAELAEILSSPLKSSGFRDWLKREIDRNNQSN